MNTHILFSTRFAILLLIPAFLFTMCGNPEGESGTSPEMGDQVGGDTGTVTKEMDMEKARKIFVMIPSPLEMASLLQKAGAKYNKDILNDPKQANKYATTQKQAINLGVYGADLSYASIYEQTQDAIYLISSCKRLAENVGVGDAFNAEIVERIETNMNNRDSMINVITDAYWIANTQLKEDKRPNVAALVIAGGWIEGLFIGTQVQKGAEQNDEIVKRISEQKYVLNDLMDLMDGFGEDEMLKEITGDLRELKTLFDSLEVSSEENSEEKDSQVVGKLRTINMAPEQLDKITKTVISIRQKYVQ